MSVKGGISQKQRGSVPLRTDEEHSKICLNFVQKASSCHWWNLMYWLNVHLLNLAVKNNLQKSYLMDVMIN